MSLYGAWISKNDFIPVKDECHAEEGLRILNSTLQVKQEHDTKQYSIYKVMYRLGYVRVFYWNEFEYSVEYWENAKLSRYQKDFIKAAKDNFPLKIYEHEWHTKNEKRGI